LIVGIECPGFLPVDHFDVMDVDDVAAVDATEDVTVKCIVVIFVKSKTPSIPVYSFIECCAAQELDWLRRSINVVQP